MNDTYSLYMHIAPNNKKYIGITKMNPEKRWGKNGYRYKTNPHFWNSIQKYGWDNFEHIILFNNLSTLEAECKERELIKENKTHMYKHGFNRDMGGFHDGFHSQSTIEKINDSRRKKVYQYSLDGKFINEFNSLTEACLKVNVSVKNVSLCCLNKTKSASNFLWSYTNNKDEILKKVLINKNKLNDGFVRKIVYQIDIHNGNIVNEYESISDAARFNDLDVSGISSCCKEKLLSYNNYIWSFDKSNDYISDRVSKNVQKAHLGLCKKVCQIDLISNKIIHTFKSATEASKFFDTYVSNITSCCTKRTKSSCGFGWTYCEEEVI